MPLKLLNSSSYAYCCSSREAVYPEVFGSLYSERVRVNVGQNSFRLHNDQWWQQEASKLDLVTSGETQTKRDRTDKRPHASMSRGRRRTKNPRKAGILQAALRSSGKLTQWNKENREPDRKLRENKLDTSSTREAYDVWAQPRANFERKHFSADGWKIQSDMLAI